MGWIQITSAEQAVEYKEWRMRYCNDKGEYFGCILRSFSVGELVYFKQEGVNGISGWVNPQRLYYETSRKEVTI